MKKIIVSLILLSVYHLSFAWDDPYKWKTAEQIVKEQDAAFEEKSTNTIWPVKVKVTENIPWAGCTCTDKNESWGCKFYTCTMQPWMTTIQLMIWQIIKWFTAIAALSWVLFIVINWILLSMHWWEKEKIKTRITTTIARISGSETSISGRSK